jgi:hypothetical protein
MTVLVTIQPVGQAITRLRRYEASPSAKRCTHAGLYDRDTVQADCILTYVERGAAQDLISTAKAGRHRTEPLDYTVA